MKNLILKSTIAMALLSMTGLVLAGTASTTLAVSATVSGNCVINTANALSFPAYDPATGSALDQNTTLSVSCTKTTPFNVGLSAGSGTGATVATRKMASGSNTLNYTIYTDAAHSTVWGNTAGTDTAAGTGSGISTPLSYTAYGRIFNQPDAVPGTYADTVTVTVTF